MRKPAPGWQIQLAKLMYPGNKKIRENLKIRHINYQKQWQIVKELEEQGNAIVLRPSADYGVTRYTHDKELLGRWFDLGYGHKKPSGYDSGIYGEIGRAICFFFIRFH